MATTNSLSRLLNLYLLLANSRHPMTLDEITRELGGFPPSFDARRQAFERAKRDLRSLGLPIVTTRDPSGSVDAYIVDSRKSVQLAPSLTPMEALSLAGAMASVRFGADAALDSATKLGCVFDGEVAALATLPKVPLVSELFEAIHRSSKVLFTYRDKERNLCPYAIVFRWGNWYLIGREDGSDTTKSFRVDYIQSALTILGIACSPPEDLVVSKVIPQTRAALDDGDHVEVVVRFRSELRDVISGYLPSLSEVEHDGSSVIGRAEIGSFESFVKVLMEFTEVFELLEPLSLKSRIAQWIERALGAQVALVDDPAELGFETGQHDIGESGSPAANGRLRRAPESTLTQFRRVMTILPWLFRNPTTTTSEIARLFNIDPDRVGGLLERIACCGLPPFTPDRLIEIIVDGDEIHARISDEFATGLKLDSRDLFVVALSAKVALAAGEFDGRPELESAMAKIFGSVGAHEISDSIVVDFAGDRNLRIVRRGLDSRNQIAFDYFSSSKAELSQRVVDPFALFSQREFWYLRGWCHLSGGVRNFRLDRMDGIAVLDRPAANQPTAQDLLPSTFSIDQNDFAGGDPVILELDETAIWRISRLPYRSLSPSPSGDKVWVELMVVSSRWLAKLIAAAGGEIRVVGPTAMARAVRAEIELIAKRLR